MPVNTKQWRTEIGSFNRPQKEKTKNVSCCLWNVNSLKAHTLSKLSQFEALSVYKHDFICIFETFFDPSIQQGEKHPA